MTLYVPDVEGLVIERLYLIYGKIEGINRRERVTPSYALGLDDTPMVYTLVGPQENFLPDTGAGLTDISELFVARLLGDPISQTDDGIRGEGTRSEAALIPFIHRFRKYFLTHPELQVGDVDDADYEGPLNGLLNQVQMRHSGVVDRPGPGGLPHYAVDFTLRVNMMAVLEGLA